MNIYETYFNVIIPVTCRVERYTRVVETYVTGT